MDYWAKSFVNAECKCEQLELALRMIDLALTCEGHATEEMIAAEECLRSLSDLRVGAALLWLWQNRDSYRRVWRSRSLELSQLHSQIREWFEDLRQAPCYDLCLADAVPNGADTESVATEGDAQDWLSKITRVPETDEMPTG